MVPLEYPTVILKDNTGVIFLAENQYVSQRTKHIDVRTRFLTALIPRAIIVFHIWTENNYADLFTKKLNAQDQDHFVHHIHNGVMEIPTITDDLECDREDVKRSGTNGKFEREKQKVILTATSLTRRPMSGLMSQSDIIDEAYELVGLNVPSSHLCPASTAQVEAQLTNCHHFEGEG